jgi:hypothetical protein
MKNILKYNIIAFCSMVLLFAGCKEKEDLGDPDRLFRPIFQNINSGGDWIKLEWERYENAEKFVLELSTVADSFATVLKTVETTEVYYQFDGLDYDTQYYVRVKSIGATLESAFYVSEMIKTDDFPTKLLPVGGNDVIDVAVKVSWTVDQPIYDRLDVYRISNDSLVASISLSPEQYAAGSLVIPGLGSDINYAVKAYSEGKYQGKKTFRTLQPQIFQGATWDLRGLSPQDALNQLTSAAIDALEAGTTVILDGGVTYNLPTIILTKDVHFITGLSFYGKAIIAVDGNFDISGTGITSVSFTNLFFSEGATKKRNTDANYGGTYLFNLSLADVVAGTVKFEGCDIRYKRGIFRLKTANITVDNIIINNCVMDSIAGYGLVNVDAACLVKNIIVTNSTISHAQKLLVNGKGTENEKVIFSDNTVYSSPNGAQYLLDFNGKAVGLIEFKNNIIGPAYAACNGIRSLAKDISLDNNYITSDFQWALNAGTGLPNMPIDPIETTVSSADLFTDPANFNFKLKVALKAGDPRWR